MLLVYHVAYIEQKTRKTDIIFNLVHGNVTNISCHYVGEFEFLWLEIGINLIKKFCVFGNTNKGANCILLFVEQSLKLDAIVLFLQKVPPPFEAQHGMP